MRKDIVDTSVYAAERASHEDAIRISDGAVAERYQNPFSFDLIGRTGNRHVCFLTYLTAG